MARHSHLLARRWDLHIQIHNDKHMFHHRPHTYLHACCMGSPRTDRLNKTTISYYQYHNHLLSVITFHLARSTMYIISHLFHPARSTMYILRRKNTKVISSYLARSTMYILKRKNTEIISSYPARSTMYIWRSRDTKVIFLPIRLEVP